MWFIDQLEPGSTAYNLCTSFHLSGRLQVSALEQSFNAIIERHETLRTTFPAVAGLPRQAVAPASQMILEPTNPTEMLKAAL